MGTSDKHKLAQDRLEKIFSHCFTRHFQEFYLPVPNPEFIIGDHDRQTTRGYRLDVFVEGPIISRFKQIRHTKIGFEVDCYKGHNTPRQSKRDNHRTEYIGEYYGVAIYRVSCHAIVGKNYRDPLNKWRPRPTLTEEQILEAVGIKLYSYEELKAQRLAQEQNIGNQI